MVEQSPKPLVIRNKDISYSHCQHSLSSDLPFFCPSGRLSLMCSSERETAHIKPALQCWIPSLWSSATKKKNKWFLTIFPAFPFTEVLLSAELVSTCRYIPQLLFFSPTIVLSMGDICRHYFAFVIEQGIRVVFPLFFFSFFAAE